MDIESYIGKPLKDFVEKTPDYAINFFMIYHKSIRGNPSHLKDVLNNEEVLNATIKSISLPYPDYTSYIVLK